MKRTYKVSLEQANTRYSLTKLAKFMNKSIGAVRYMLKARKKVYIEIEENLVGWYEDMG